MTVPEWRIFDSMGYSADDQRAIAEDQDLARHVRGSLGYAHTRLWLETRRVALAILGTFSHEHSRQLHLERREDAQRARREAVGL